MRIPGDYIASFRKEKGLTQEELARFVGVSGQAVSKWENGGVPDAALLPAIASALGVSIDALFGRGPKPEDAEDALAREIAALPSDERIVRLFSLRWRLQRALMGDDRAQKDLPPQSDSHSQIAWPDGLSCMRLSPELRYAFLAAEPEGGFARALAEPAACTAFFALIGQRDAYDLLVFLHSRDASPFTARFVAQRLQIDTERAEALLAAFSGYGLAAAQTLLLDEKELTVYTARPNPAIVPLLAFTGEFVRRPTFFNYQCDGHGRPWLAEKP